MSARKVHKDKQGPYITDKRRKFRPTGPTAAQAGDQVQMYWQGPSADQDERKFYKWKIDPATGLILRDPVNRTHVHEYVEVWRSTDVAPQIREHLKDGQMNLSIMANGRQATIVVGADGFNYRDYRKEPKASQKHTAGMNVFITNKLMFNWDEWDAVVAAVEQARDTVEIAPITMALQAEIDAEDEVQEFLAKNGLVPTAPADGENTN